MKYIFECLDGTNFHGVIRLTRYTRHSNDLYSIGRKRTRPTWGLMILLRLMTVARP